MNPNSTIDQKIIHEILTVLTKHPEDIQIKREVAEDGVVVLSIKVHASDMGIVIGKSGSMATAFKTLIKALGKVNDTNIKIVFEEPEGSLFANRQFTPKPAMADNEPPKSASNTEHTHNFDHDLDDLVIN
jgi:predicted RNA-binding protein YlqC (UPF0109 family)